MTDSLVELVRRALAEDVGDGDITTLATIPEDLRGKGRIRARVTGVVSGLGVAVKVFHEVDSDLLVDAVRSDGDRVDPGVDVLAVSGRVRSILTGERVALNFLTHLSGVATLTSRFVEAAAGKIQILDTRKTLPGFRELEKKAVVDGGGVNHRMGLYDAILIKDNHVEASGSLEKAVERARESYPDKRIMLEVESFEQAQRAARLGVHHLLLDNMSPEEIRRIVMALEGSESRPYLEISGGVMLDTVATYAETGADGVSVGALTHSAPALDLGLDLDPLS
jgi:nicotinate-nucleotide pyrophosphorylase (carboxylating)